jgi:acyl transferase domain-containing protein
MAAGLYEWDPVFTEAMDTVFDALGAVGSRIRDDWLAEEPEVCLDEVSRAQPLLFAVDHALGRMVRSWGVETVALLGHSAGELAAGVLAGIIALPDAAREMWDRADRLSRMPPGGMLAVASPPDGLAPFLRDDVVVGAVNGPRQTMLSGPSEPLSEVTAQLRAAGFTCQEVRATTAFHSPAVSGAVHTGAFSAVRLRPPATPLWSAYAVGPLGAALATDPAFWARHPVDPVLFGPALDGLLDSADLFLVESGPAQGLTTLARRHHRVRRGFSSATALLPPVSLGDEADRRSVGEAVRRMRAEGHLLPELSG